MPTYSTYTDEQLLALLAISDKQAFTELYERYWEKLFVTACSRLDNPPEAEELVQDVFYKLWRRREELQLSHQLNTYLAAAVKYEVINRLARLRRSSTVSNINYEPVSNITEHQLSFNELQSRLVKLVKQLPDKCRLVFTLSRDEGLSQKEIAKQLNISENTVESHIKHALKTLRTGLQQMLWGLF